MRGFCYYYFFDFFLIFFCKLGHICEMSSSLLFPVLILCEILRMNTKQNQFLSDILSSRNGYNNNNRFDKQGFLFSSEHQNQYYLLFFVT